METNGHTESCRDTNDEALALELSGQVDLPPGRAFNEVHVGNAVSCFDHGGGGGAKVSKRFVGKLSR